MKLVKNWLNADEHPYRGEINRLPSLTIPDQAMSMQEILDRQSRGIPMVGEKFPIYYGEDEELPDFRHMDLADLQAHREMLTQRIADQRADLIAQDEERKRADVRKWDERKRDILATATQFFKRPASEPEKPDSSEKPINP